MDLYSCQLRFGEDRGNTPFQPVSTTLEDLAETITF